VPETAPGIAAGLVAVLKPVLRAGPPSTPGCVFVLTACVGAVGRPWLVLAAVGAAKCFAVAGGRDVAALPGLVTRPEKFGRVGVGSTVGSGGLACAVTATPQNDKAIAAQAATRAKFAPRIRATAITRSCRPDPDRPPGLP